MTSDRIKTKAEAYLTQGRVAAVEVTAATAHFSVAGSAAEPYKVRFLNGWACTCPAQTDTCAHIVACQKVTRLEAGRQVLFTDDSDLSRFLHDALKGPR